MSKEVAETQERSNGRFVPGQSGNPAGRPRGSKNQLTVLRQSLEIALREQSGPHLTEVLDKAISLALQGDRQMIKLLLELHMTKGVADEREATEKVSITIGTTQSQPIVINGETQNETRIQTDASSDTLLPDPIEREGDEVSGVKQTGECKPDG